MLSSFLKTKDSKVVAEVEWLKFIGADCVLSDSAFLGWYVSPSGKRRTLMANIPLKSKPGSQGSPYPLDPCYEFHVRLRVQLYVQSDCR